MVSVRCKALPPLPGPAWANDLADLTPNLLKSLSRTQDIHLYTYRATPVKAIPLLGHEVLAERRGLTLETYVIEVKLKNILSALMEKNLSGATAEQQH